jgi:hypothetical protein
LFIDLDNRTASHETTDIEPGCRLIVRIVTISISEEENSVLCFDLAVRSRIAFQALAERALTVVHTDACATYANTCQQIASQHHNAEQRSRTAAAAADATGFRIGRTGNVAPFHFKVPFRDRLHKCEQINKYFSPK